MGFLTPVGTFLLSISPNGGMGTHSIPFLMILEHFLSKNPLLGGTIALQGQNMSQKTATLVIFCAFLGQKKVEFEGVGPIWRDARRNSASNPASDVQNGWMATRLVPKRCDLGSLGVPGPASTPLGPPGGYFCQPLLLPTS